MDGCEMKLQAAAGVITGLLVALEDGDDVEDALSRAHQWMEDVGNAVLSEEVT